MCCRCLKTAFYVIMFTCLTTVGQCETFNKTCYTISQKKSNFSSSLLSCESKQESIIEISKKAEYNFIKQEFGGRNLDVWLGVVKPINSSSYQYLKGNKSADLSELDDEFKVKAKLSERFCITIKITKNLNFIEKQCDFRLSSYVCYKKMKQATAIELMILKNISSKIVQAQAGETVNLRCAATGMSNMKFSWSKDGRGLENVLETYEGNQSTIVSVTIRNNKDFGKYKCTIKDGFSERNLTIWVENWSEGGSNDDKVLLTVTITLTVFVVILIAIIFCCFKHNKQLKRSLKRSNDSGVEMTNASNDRREEQTTKGYEDGTIGNEMSQYTL
ncbi:uncharacterized protein LOC124451917 isoform X2 [Xenia sp. Carnegie-2017]|uniref:uncharacterized protein LOC124451917 isoform X2 n=1 Tax=Xenia sp. Carnegie-2017 TaxID=2897299 RepID=UPI001F04AC84|nr:uncharacterized protein LOC124451917 isoform X2 [Xenia sp. Carnegie-2017]